VFPLGVMLAIIVRLDSPGPAIFRQRRIGRDGRPFICYKFRTMVVDAEERKAELAALNEADGPLFKIRNDPRMTRVGRFLRRYSLDELPQLWNILRGDMSWVGPRPATPEEVAQYEDWHYRRLTVVPGLTGLSQVLGRSDISFDETVRLDIFYTETGLLAWICAFYCKRSPWLSPGAGHIEIRGGMVEDQALNGWMQIVIVSASSASRCSGTERVPALPGCAGVSFA
jgi:Sugar transferases involved in lipopolysaccharide synthesis